MKTAHLFLLLATASPAALFLSGCSKSDDSPSTMDKAKADASALATDVKDAVSNSWDSIKDYTYEKRTDFSAHVSRMSGELDDKTRGMKAKFANAPDSAARGWDGAVKNYDEARADLDAKLSELGSATADTWAGAKEKVAQAWKRVQAASDKMKASVSN